MKTKIISLLLFVAFQSLSSCHAGIVPEIRLPSPVAEIYEDQEGLHVITSKGSGLDIEYSDILIELEDEIEVYYFELNGKVETVRYFREGNEKQGTTGVFIVIRDQVYSIDSHHLSK